MKEPTTPRRDSLPEHAEYRDEGCDLSPSCLACPLARCRYDEPGGARTILRRERDAELLRLSSESVPLQDIAARCHVSRRTVHRVLARASRGETYI